MKKIYQVLFSLTILVACLWATSLSAEAHVKKVSKPVSTKGYTSIFNTDSSIYINYKMKSNNQIASPLKILTMQLLPYFSGKIQQPLPSLQKIEHKIS